MTDYISREATIKAAKCHYPKANEMIAGIILVPAADVVARDCYDRILAENDTMREMLARIGKNCGDSMDDVRPVARARWYWDNYRYDWCCSNCFHPADHHIDKDDVYKMPSFPFCPHCGADMQEPNLDTTKGENHD